MGGHGLIDLVSHFIPINSSYSAEDYSRIFLLEIMCLHGIPLTIILDWDSQFTSRFLRLFLKGLGTTVKLATTFNPQMDGQEESTVQNLDDMLTACIIDFKGRLDRH